VQLFGESGLVEIEIPVNAPPDRETVLNVRTSAGSRTETIPPGDQYTLQGDAFSRAILEDTEVPVPLEDAIRNMEVIDALFESGRTGRWVTVHI
jgi:predicted dehydrogenase